MNSLNERLEEKAEVISGTPAKSRDTGVKLTKNMTISDMIKALEPEIKRALPSVLTPERFTRMALSAINNTPKLAECSPMSFIAALMVKDKIEQTKKAVKNAREPEKNTGRKSIYELISDDITNSDMDESEKSKRLSRVIQLRSKKVNILFAGATGAGKSSTINAMFNMEVAKVGLGVDPETSRLTSYELDNLIIWDTPGLGDGKSDKAYNKQIVKKLSELDDNGDPLIDLVFGVLDASSKDLGTSYNLINDVIIPCLGEEAEKRILVGLNQADMAMKGKHWNDVENEPDETLLNFLERKTESVKSRIAEVTGVEIQPVFYSAGYMEDENDQRKPYNLTKLLYYIVDAIPRDKRLTVADNLNTNTDMWEHGDSNDEYKEKTGKTFTGEITNNSGIDLSGACVIVVYMSEGRMIGGETTYADSIKSGEMRPFELSASTGLNYDRYEMYAMQW